jgi:hypothetical protein
MATDGAMKIQLSLEVPAHPLRTVHIVKCIATEAQLRQLFERVCVMRWYDQLVDSRYYLLPPHRWRW